MDTDDYNGGHSSSSISSSSSTSAASASASASVSSSSSTENITNVEEEEWNTFEIVDMLLNGMTSIAI